MSPEKFVFRSGIHLSLKKYVYFKNTSLYFIIFLVDNDILVVEMEPSHIETKYFERELLNSEALW